MSSRNTRRPVELCGKGTFRAADQTRGITIKGACRSAAGPAYPSRCGAQPGGLVRSEAKRKANRENGRNGGLVKSPKKKIAARRSARRPRPGRRRNSSKPYSRQSLCHRLWEAAASALSEVASWERQANPNQNDHGDGGCEYVILPLSVNCRAGE
jgi:hypothetical protein